MQGFLSAAHMKGQVTSIDFLLVQAIFHANRLLSAFAFQHVFPEWFNLLAT